MSSGLCKDQHLFSPSDVLASVITEELEAALEQFPAITEDLRR
jgi:hypothetical protein